MYMSPFDFSIRIACSVLFGFLIGLERQHTGHPAGIQTNVLVCVGACIFQLVSFMMEVHDTARIAAQVVTGVGFLGSGIIFRDGINVRGINTAATIWCGAAIGLLTSTGYLIYAFAATICIVIVNILFQQSSGVKNIFPKPLLTVKYYKIYITCSKSNAAFIRTLLVNQCSMTKLTLTDVNSVADASETNAQTEITAVFFHKGKKGETCIEGLIAKLSAEESVSSIKWELI
jgi:putative Mg2+ transporter-C (MgtC) family protein